MENRPINSAALNSTPAGVMRLVDSEQMAAIDQAASEHFGIPSLITMENAGLKALSTIQQQIWHREFPQEKVTIVSGRGNNGGDALVIARQLSTIGVHNLTVLLSHGEPKTGSQCAINLSICRNLGILVQDGAEAEIKSGWVIDGISGTGQQGALRGPASMLAEKINSSPAKVIALDVPSGIGDQFSSGMLSVQADWTLALELPKRSLYLPLARPACGEIIVVPIGLPASLTGMAGAKGRLLRKNSLAALLPTVAPEAHKGMRGHVAVLAGSAGTPGAARLAATAAACSRAGLVTLHADADTYAIQASALTSVMVTPWSEAVDPDDLTRPADSLVVGPGWGTEPGRFRWLNQLLALPCCGVLDADAITLLAQSRDATGPLAGDWVLTPHPGELARFLDATVPEVLADPNAAAAEVAERFGAVVVLKGHVTYVLAPGVNDDTVHSVEPSLSVVDGMQPWLATGGSGDVLAGVIGALLASRQLSAYQAACAGVLLHAAAARSLYNERGWFLAEDLLQALPHVLADVSEIE